MDTQFCHINRLNDITSYQAFIGAQEDVHFGCCGEVSRKCFDAYFIWSIHEEGASRSIQPVT